MKKLVIDREKWQRGDMEGHTYLLNPQNRRMCCLGFDAINEGLSKSQINGVTEPEDLNVKINGITFKNLKHTNVTLKLMHANDNTEISEEKREKKITSLFKKIGREVEFINLGWYG